MLKINQVFTALPLVLIPFLNNPVLALPSGQTAGYPVITNSATKELLCYIQMEDGRILDLRNLCSRQKVNGANLQSGSTTKNYNPVFNSYNPNSNTPTSSRYNPNINTRTSPSSYNPNIH